MTEHLSTKAPEGVTCDSCSEGGKRCIVEPETGAYICEDCQAFHERAVVASARAMHRAAYERVGGDDLDTAWDRAMQQDRDLWINYAQIAVKVYCEFTDEPEAP